MEHLSTLAAIAKFLGVETKHLKKAFNSYVRKNVVFNDNWNKENLKTTFKCVRVVNKINYILNGSCGTQVLSEKKFIDFFNENLLTSEKTELASYIHKY